MPKSWVVPVLVGTQHTTATTFWHSPETDRSQTQHRIILLCPSYVAAHDNKPWCFRELLHNMDIVEWFSVEFVTYQFQGNAKMWWRLYVECQPATAPPMTWAAFSNLFMEKYIPRTLRDRRKHEFLSLEQGRISFAAYEAKFRALSRYATQLCFSTQEQILRFVKGLR